MTGSVLVSGDQLGTPDFRWGPAQPRVGQAVSFAPSAFTDPDGSIASYAWDLDGNGSFEASGSAPTHTYNNAGTYMVALTYTDDRGETSPATRHELVIAPAPGAGGPAGGGNPRRSDRDRRRHGRAHPAERARQPLPKKKKKKISGTVDEETQGATRLRIGTRALAFHDNKARIAVTGAPSGKDPDRPC